MNINPGIFKAYDIRGLYPGEIDETTARQIGRGFVSYLKASRIAVSRDMRVSSPALAAAFIEGAREQGASVVDYGMLPTDVLYYAVVTDNLEGGAQITASHNPKQYTGMKIVRAGALPVGGESGLLDVRDRAVAGAWHRAARGEIRLDRLLVINPGGGPLSLPGEPTREPVFDLPALWIDRELRDEAGLRGLTVVDCGTIITTHLTELVKDNIADLLSYTETQKLLNEVHKESDKLVADIVPSKISISGVQRILQNLLAEGISIRDVPASVGVEPSKILRFQKVVVRFLPNVIGSPSVPAEAGYRSTSSHSKMRIGRDASEAAEFAPAIVRWPPLNVLWRRV